MISRPVGTTAKHREGKHDERVSVHLTWLLVVNFFGYPFLGTLVTLTSQPSRVASVPVRLSVIVLSLSLLLVVRPGAIFRVAVKKIPTNPIGSAMMLFWVIYIFRLIWDWQVQASPDAGFALLLMSVAGLLPSLGILCVDKSRWDAARFTKLAFFLGSATCMLGVGITLLGLAGERSLLSETGRLGFDTVNPITYGYVAVTTLLAALVGWPSRRMLQLPVLLITVAGVAAAVICLQMTASKGPIVALIVCLTALAVFHRRFHGVFLISILILAAYLFYDHDAGLAQRIFGADEDPSTLDRVTLLTNSVDQFLGHPILGSAYLEKEMKTYPHNLIVEAAMATGIFGALVYLFVTLNCGWKLLRILRREDTLVFSILATQYFISEQISGSLWASGNIWVSFAIILAISRGRKSVEPGQEDCPEHVRRHGLHIGGNSP